MGLQKSLVCVALCVAGCGSDEERVAGNLDVVFSGDAPDGQETQSSYTFVSLCDGLARTCCKIDQCIVPGQVPPDCFEQTRTLCEDTVRGPLLTHLDGGELAFHDDAANACYAAFEAVSCDDLGSLTGAPPAECSAGFTGTIAEGASCAFDAVCAAGLFCKPGGDGTCPGTCQPRKALGAACNEDDALCAKDLLCARQQSGQDGVCVAAKVALGEACLSYAQCPEGTAYCSKATGKCETRRGGGEPCPEKSECMFADGLVCAGEAGQETCQAAPGEGAACNGSCADGFICGFDKKVCAKQPALGEPCIDPITGCGAFNGLQCDPATQRCVAWLALGAVCGGPNGLSRCLGSYCDGDFDKTGHCVANKRLGDACTGFKECGRLACIEGHCASSQNACRGPGRLDECYP